MAQALDEVLTDKDVGDVVEFLLPAKNKSYELGLKLNLPSYDLDSIFSTNSDRQICLRIIIKQFLDQSERPTWRIIIVALRSPLVNLPKLARSVEKHFLLDHHIPDEDEENAGAVSILHHSDVDTKQDHPHSPPSTFSSTEGAVMTGAQSPRQESPEPNPMTSVYVKDKIRKFEKRFNELKRAARACLEKRGISVAQIVDAFTSMPADDLDEHKQFLEEHLKDLYECLDVAELIGRLSVLHWDYLSYQLLEYIIKEFKLEVEKEMETYKFDLRRFRLKTPLTLYCRSQKRRRRKPSEDFKKMVAIFEWPQEVTLEVVEQFREEYACHYGLRECAMLLAEVRPGSFIITWFVPGSVVKKLKEDIPTRILKVYSVSQLDIAGEQIYPTPNGIDVEISDSAGPSPDDPDESADLLRHEKSSLSPYEDYPFIERQSQDFFCPVTLGLLIEPHLTSCCGKFLSDDAAMRLQDERKPCPLCKATGWSTVLEKHIRREVREIPVFCWHREKGCWWRGELSNLNHHSLSCQFRLIGDEKQGGTELHDAAWSGDVVSVKRMLSTTSVNVNFRTKDDGTTALVLASLAGHVEIVHLLLQAQAFPYLTDKNGFSPIYVASHEGNTEVVDVLAKAGADVNQVMTLEPFSVPLGVASEAGHTETVKKLLEAGANINLSNKSGFSPVYIASMKGHSNVVTVLVEAGTDVNQPLNIEPHSVPLDIAAEMGNTEIVETLIKGGALVNHQNNYGQTAIWCASWKGHAAIVHLLLQNGANPSIPNKGGLSAVFVACDKGHIEVLKILVKAGADVNQAAAMSPGPAPLGIAAVKGDTEIVQVLLDAGADVNQQDKERGTALLQAGWGGQTEVVKLLLAAGARDTPDKYGRTALSKAEESRHDDVVQCLKTQMEQVD